MGYGEAEAASGLRLCLGPWLRREDVRDLPDALQRAQRHVEVEAGEASDRP
jgi:cysteine desulfurase